MSKTVFCKKLQKDLPAMTAPPMPGPKGKELMETISNDAWEEACSTSSLSNNAHK